MRERIVIACGDNSMNRAQKNKSEELQIVQSWRGR